MFTTISVNIDTGEDTKDLDLSLEDIGLTDEEWKEMDFAEKNDAVLDHLGLLVFPDVSWVEDEE